MQDAVRRGDVAKVRELASTPQFVNDFNVKSKNTPLHTALGFENTEIVKILVTNGASLDAKNVIGNKPIHIASIYGHVDGIKYLLEQRKNLVNEINLRHETPLHLAVCYNHPWCVELLIENGASLKAKDGIGDTPLFTAIQYRRLECLQTLLECGTSVFVVNRAGDSPVEAAKDLHYEDIIEILETYQFQGLFKELTGLGVETMDEFKDMLSEGSFQCFWNRVYLVGPYNVGKTTLAKNLVGDPIPEERKSTDGIWIYLGRAGMDIDELKWIYLPQGTSLNAAVQSMLIHTTKDEEQTPDNDTPLNSPIPMDSIEEVKTEIVAQKKNTEATRAPKTPTKTVIVVDNSSEKEVEFALPLPPRKYLEIENVHELPGDTKSMSNEEILNMVLSACRAGEYKMKIVPIDLWDFGGQKIYYMTHQLFISSRGVFVIIFNGSKGIHDDISDLSFLPGQYGKRTIAVYLMHWVNSILTYCKTSKAGFPRILFVATHKDLIEKGKYIQQKDDLTHDIEKLFEKHSGKKHLMIRPLIFVNAKDTADPEVEELRKVLVESAFAHPRWGELMPTLCVPLELQLAERVKKGQKIMSLDEVEQINLMNGKMALSRSQLTTFLKLQHALGKYIYFDKGILSKYVVTDPSYLIEVLRSVVTEEVFWPKDQKFRDIFMSLKEKGILYEVDLLMLWEQEEFKHILEYKDYMIEMLVHLDIIIRPRSNFISGQTVTEEVKYYMVPCMIAKQKECGNVKDHTSIFLAYRFNEDIIPPAFLYKFLGTFVSMWSIKSMFTDSAIVSIDKCHDLVVYVEGRRLVAELAHSTNQDEIVPTIASTVQECLTRAIIEISSFYWSAAESDTSSDVASSKKKSAQELCCLPKVEQTGKQKRIIPYSIEFGLRCGAPLNLCFVEHSFVSERRDYQWECKDHKKKHDASREVQLWISEQSLQFARKEAGLVCDTACPGLEQLRLERCPTDQQLGRLAAMFNKGVVKDIFLALGLSSVQWDDIQEDYPYSWDQKFFAFWEWKRNFPKPTFACLKDVLPKADQDHHKLCEVFRDFELADLPKEEMSPEAKDHLLEVLSNNVGKDVVRLGLELELKGKELEEIALKHKAKLMEQTRDVLRKWKKKNQPIFVLARAFNRIGKYGVFRQCIPEHSE